jgi:hypothetical protein
VSGVGNGGRGLRWQHIMTKLSEAKSLDNLMHAIHLYFRLCSIPTAFSKLDARLQLEEEHFTTATVPTSMSPCFDQH